MCQLLLKRHGTLLLLGEKLERILHISLLEEGLVRVVSSQIFITAAKGLMMTQLTMQG